MQFLIKLKDSWYERFALECPVPNSGMYKSYPCPVSSYSFKIEFIDSFIVSAVPWALFFKSNSETATR